MVSKAFTISDFQPGGRLYRPPAVSEEGSKALEAGKSAIHSLEKAMDVHRRILSGLDRLDEKLENAEQKYEETNNLVNKNNARIAIRGALITLSVGATCLLVTNLYLKYYAR